MFGKKIVEKKQQIDNLLSLQKQIKNLIVESRQDDVIVKINSQFEIIDISFDVSNYFDDYIEHHQYQGKEFSKILIIAINMGIKKMQEEIQKKSSEIFSGKK